MYVGINPCLKDFLKKKHSYLQKLRHFNKGENNPCRLTNWELETCEGCFEGLTCTPAVSIL